MFHMHYWWLSLGTWLKSISIQAQTTLSEMLWIVLTILALNACTHFHHTLTYCRIETKLIWKSRCAVRYNMRAFRFLIVTIDIIGTIQKRGYTHYIPSCCTQMQTLLMCTVMWFRFSCFSTTPFNCSIMWHCKMKG